LNYAPHYRLNVFKTISAEIDADFFFGNSLPSKIKKLDYLELRNTHEVKSYWFFNGVYWMTGVLNLLFKPYKQYIITGQINCITNWIFIPLAKIFGKKVYIWNHGWYGKETKGEIIIKKVYYKLVSGFFLYGEYACNLMKKQGYNSSKLNVVYNSLDYFKSIELRNKLVKTNVFRARFNNNFHTLIFIGRLQAVKKLDMLIDAVIQLNERGLRLNLVFVGDGSEKEALEKKVQKEKLCSQVWFFGSCYDEEIISNLIYNADLSVSPGNVGLTAVHSMSYGTPVITHNDFKNQMPEFEVITSGLTGDFFEKDNLMDLISKLENWILKFQKQRTQVELNCYNVVDSKYNPIFLVNKFKAVLNIK
jgi:glycosyltransferase involved in cell wall biosynthesis